MAQGTGTPKVSVNVASGNLLRQIQVIDGVAGIVGTAYVKIGVIETIYSYDDAVAKGYTVIDEPFLNAQIKQFYEELGGNQELWILGVEDTMTLESMVNSTNANGLKKLLTISQGRVNVVYVCRKPAGSYTMPAGFLDKDVENAIIGSKTICQYQQSINRPIRILIEGRVKDATVNPYYKPNTASNTYVGVVLGSNLNNGSASGALALARACKYGAHIKLGNGQNGALSLTQAYIGNKTLEEFDPIELDNFSNAGYIVMHHREGMAGYYFGVDNMAGADDFRILVHGRLIDKAQRIATATTTPFLETSVRVNADGTINSTDAVYMEDLVKAQIRAKMGDQISGVDVIIPTNQDIINTNTMGMQVKIQPFGYLTWFIITLGLTKNL
ncbi:conserved hypothetical protein [Flavobacterium psychrophilum]|uniref:DUF2586 family protein n=1 Tax=Flavobacterium psychrophilum TaxID=96345 RepID=UPI000B7C4719|nr:DUF2586 family protein [Flavobacterium psychrophilum]SNB26507.1 conserved hypothetical protein [Flavobacterium psychrophilum]